MCPGLTVFSSMIWCLCHCGKVDDTEKYLRTMKAFQKAVLVIYVKFLLLSFKQIRILTHQLGFIIWLCILEIKKGGCKHIEFATQKLRRKQAFGTLSNL